MQLEPGMRVRCAVPDLCRYLATGGEYTVKELLNDNRYVYLREIYGSWQASRFKPIVRVKMGRAVA